jgi:hypothetical protein
MKTHVVVFWVKIKETLPSQTPASSDITTRCPNPEYQGMHINIILYCTFRSPK